MLASGVALGKWVLRAWFRAYAFRASSFAFQVLPPGFKVSTLWDLEGLIFEAYAFWIQASDSLFRAPLAQVAVLLGEPFGT